MKEKKSKHFLNKPTYVGGPKALKAFISENIKYPTEALAANLEGSVSLKYSIDNKGKVIEVRIISGLSPECDAEATRLVKMLKFTKAKNRGVRAIFHKDLTIHFRKPKKQEVAKIPITQPTAKVVQPQPTAQNIHYVVTKQEKEIPEAPEETGGGYTYTINW